MDKPWYEQPDKLIAGAVSEVGHSLLEQQSERQSQYERFLKNYRNATMASLQTSGLPVQLAQRLSAMLRTPLSFNITQSMADAFVSKVGKHRVRILYTTRGAGRKAREQAQKAQWYMDGVVYTERVHRKDLRVTMDCTLFGNGYFYIYWLGGPRVERVFGPEVVVDDVEGFSGDPQCMYRHTFIHRRVLARRYPKAAKELEGLKEGMDGGQDIWFRSRYGGAGDSDMLMVRHAVALPSGPGAGDGVEALVCGDVLLRRKAWKYDWHPYVTQRYSEPPDGFYGIGLAEKLQGMHYELNRLLRVVQNVHAMLAHPFIFIEKSAGISPAHLRGVNGTVLSYNRHKPEIYVPQTVHPEVYNQIDRIYSRAHEIAGLSEASVAGRPFPGQETGRAHLVAAEQASDRFSWFQRDREFVHIEVMRRVWELCAEHNYTSRALTRQGFEELNWKDLGVEPDGIVMRGMPTSIMPDTAEGMIDQVDRLRNSGLVVDREAQLDLMGDVPELDRYMNRELSQKRYVEKTIEAMLDGGPFEAPIPELNFDKAIVTARAMYIEAVTEGMTKEKNLYKVIRWIEYARLQRAEQKKAEQGLPTGPGVGVSGEAAAEAAMAAEGIPGAAAGELLPPEGMAAMTPEAGGAAPPPVGANQVAQMMAQLGGQ